MSEVDDINAKFATIDASLRRLCTETTFLDSPWSGGSGVGLVKRNDINFPSRAQKISKSLPGDYTAPGPPRGSGSRNSPRSWRKMGSGEGDHLDDAWHSWMDQSADLEALGSDELPPEDILRQAQELGAAAARRSAALDMVIDMNPSRADNVSGPLVQSALPPVAVPAQEAAAADELLTMLQEQAVIPTRDKEFQRRIDSLRGMPSITRPCGASRDTDFQARLRQLNLAQVNSPEDVNGATVQRRHTGTTETGQHDAAVLPEPTSPTQEQSRTLVVSPSRSSVAGVQKDSAAGTAEVDALLAELQDGGKCAGAASEAPSTPALSDLDEFEAQQVQQLVERATLSGDLSVSPERTGDLDDRVRGQWHEQWDQSGHSGGIGSEPNPGQGLVDSFMPGSSQLEQELAGPGQGEEDVKGSGNGSETEEGVDAVKWSAEDMQRPEVKEALELDGKLQTSMALTSDDQRRPRWLGEIAIRSADRGLKALQGHDLKLANAMIKTCLAASAQVDLQPGNKAKVDAFCLRLHQAQAARAMKLISDAKEKVKIQQPTLNNPVSGFPSAPGPAVDD